MAKLSPRNFIYFEIFFILNIRWFTELTGFPAWLSRLDMVFTFVLLIWQFNKVATFIRKHNAIKIILSFYCISIFIGWLFNGLDVAYVLWNLTLTFFYILFFIICSVTLKKDDVIHVLELLCTFEIFNFAISLYQYFFLDISHDYLGGLFGTQQGCNGFTYIFGAILSAYLLATLVQKKSLIRAMLYIASVLVVAMLADILGLVFAIGISIVITMIFMRVGIKKFVFIIGAFLLGMIAINIMKYDAPVRFQYFTDFSNLLRYAGLGADSAGGIYGVSRTNPFAQINNMFFNHNILKELFGFGFGNCLYVASFSSLQSAIYRSAGSYSYWWFSHAYTYMETGLCGVITYIALFVTNFIFSIKVYKTKTKRWGLFGMLVTISAFVAYFYNQSLMLSSGYLMYFAMAVPYIMGNDGDVQHIDYAGFFNVNIHKRKIQLRPSKLKKIN